jgi:serine/threonine-protein kinase
MALAVGTRFGRYEVLAVIGAGQMGEVYRARDTELQRDVAIKVLPESMASHPRRLLRFEREARALAALNHPNIATVFGIEDPADGSTRSRALAMELVEGDDLSWRLLRGRPDVTETLSIARQVASALHAAHEAGIVHRDLKPANIKVRADGTVKVLDFGLAKAGDADPPSDEGTPIGRRAGHSDATATQTLEAALTLDGAVVGTAAYMSPEQVAGSPVDRRTDVWAFGVVLFEMLAGRRPFEADDVGETLARVVSREPDWAALPAGTPRSLVRLLKRCLTRDRRLRLHDMADACLDLDDAMTEGTSAPRAERWRTGWTTGVAAALCLAIGLGAGMLLGRHPAPGEVLHVGLAVTPADGVDAGGMHPAIVLPVAGARTSLAWTPDGRSIVFIGVRSGIRQIYRRDLAGASAVALSGTEGAMAMALSPDGHDVVFWAGGALQRVALTGGPAVKLRDVGVVNGLCWGERRIVFVDAPGMSEIRPDGSGWRQITQPPDLVRHSTPFLLPGDGALLYTEYRKQWTSGNEQVFILPLAPGARPRLLLQNAADARYVPGGHLTFLRRGTLFVVGFDVATLQLRGEPVAVMEDIAQASVALDSDDLTLAGHYAVSPQGSLAFIASPPPTYPDRELVSIDRQGVITPLGMPKRGYRNHVELSPDGSKLAVSIQTATDIRGFAYDLRLGRLVRLAETVAGEVIVAAWSRNNRIALQVIDDGRIGTVIVGPDAADPIVRVTAPGGFWANSWSPDGQVAGSKEGQLWLIPPDSAATAPTVFSAVRSSELQPTWSPDGRWLAYSSAATGRMEIYVRPYPGPGEAVVVSANGGSSPAWNPGGGELFYVEPGPQQDRMMAVRLGPGGHPGTPSVLFACDRRELFLRSAVQTPYAVAPDGRRFFAVRQPLAPSHPPATIDLVTHWASTWP